MKDTLKHKGLRNQLAALLATKGITDLHVLEAIKAVPRHLFLDSGFEAHAYQNKAFPIAAGQTISQPYTVAFQTQLLQVKPNNTILEIGTGSGYQTAMLIHLGAKVYTIERQGTLFKNTKCFLEKINYRPKKMIFGDGYKGLPEHAPYDGIIVTAGAPQIPQALLTQLKIGGKLVIPVGVDTQIMTVCTRTAEKTVEQHQFGHFRFVPLVENKN